MIHKNTKTSKKTSETTNSGNIENITTDIEPCFECPLVIGISSRVNEYQYSLIEKASTLEGLKIGQYIRAAVVKKAYRDLRENGLI